MLSVVEDKIGVWRLRKVCCVISVLAFLQRAGWWATLPRGFTSHGPAPGSPPHFPRIPPKLNLNWVKIEQNTQKF